MKSLNKPDPKDVSLKSGSMPLSPDSLSKRYPFVKPEVWAVPMSDAERRDLMADLDAEAKKVA